MSGVTVTDSSSSETEEEMVAGKDSGYRWEVRGVV